MNNDDKQIKLRNLSKLLPDDCQSFLLETGTEMAISTRLAYADELKWFFEYLIGYSPIFCDLELRDIETSHIKQITPQDVSRYLSLCKDKGNMERTVARKRASLSRFFTYLADNRIIDYNPVSAAVKVKVHKSDEVIHLDLNEQNILLSSVDDGSMLDAKKQKYHTRYRDRDLALITLLLDTGMRVSELRSININDIDFDKCSVLIVRKGGNKQTVFFSDEARMLIEQYISIRREYFPALPDTEPLFVTLKGKRLSVRAIEMLVKKYTTAAIPGKGKSLSPHKMRSSYAMGYYQATGGDILGLQRNLGHKSLAATNIYALATENMVKETRSVMSDARNMAKNE